MGKTGEKKYFSEDAFERVLVEDEKHGEKKPRAGKKKRAKIKSAFLEPEAAAVATTEKPKQQKMSRKERDAKKIARSNPGRKIQICYSGRRRYVMFSSWSTGRSCGCQTYRLRKRTFRVI